MLVMVFNHLLTGHCGLSSGSDGKEYACNIGEPSSIPRSGRSPGGGHINPPVFLPGESHGQKSLAGLSPWGCRELQTAVANTWTFSPGSDQRCLCSPSSLKGELD